MMRVMMRVMMTSWQEMGLARGVSQNCYSYARQASHRASATLA
ncbi:hypothetical protein EDWATA_03386 [Edwardsiella tarda ATCC 23685]|uniref:Uncharacterized protein n=1 Tax=Edwardsiella tarda ATCC 23685 TaxID=500638 RepID=D4F9C8_EDWTA|nr:hypothetical protein EDWATA_03386 [Edwardsiella tarda ATCC 23685]